eukprot:SAG31_NODE_14989_length_777_cov_0.973451_1_plen_60_part_00
MYFYKLPPGQNSGLPILNLVRVPVFKSQMKEPHWIHRFLTSPSKVLTGIPTGERRDLKI